MSSTAASQRANTHASIIPTLRYADAAAAIEWLCRAFGFTRHLVVAADEGAIAHAQLVFGNGMIMLGSAGAEAFDDLQKPPHDPQAPVSQSPYIIVEDVDEHYTRALAAGATIVLAPADQEYGGRLYSCRDPEGNLWNFGSYNPWLENA